MSFSRQQKKIRAQINAILHFNAVRLLNEWNNSCLLMTNFHRELEGCQYDRNDRKGASSEWRDDRVLDALT